MDGDKRAITIDEVPFEWCLQPAVKLDIRHFPDGYVITPADVEQELDRVGHTLAPPEIVLVNTAPELGTASRTTSAAAAGWAVRQRCTCWSVACSSRHRRLESLPPNGFEVACFPVKVHAASAARTRAVAIFNDDR